MDRDELKAMVGAAAVSYVSTDTVLGVGTGSTVGAFIDALAATDVRPSGAVSSSEATSARLRAIGIAVIEPSDARDLNLAWLEEPVRWYDQIEGNARVRTGGIPVNLGQGEICRHGCRDLILRGAVDILNVDVTIAAGVTEWRRIAGMASSFGVNMAHHEEPQVALHLLAAAANGLCVEIFPNYNRDPMWFDLPEKRPAIKDGFMHLPAGDGFGIPLRADTIEKYRIEVS